MRPIKFALYFLILGPSVTGCGSVVSPLADSRLPDSTPGMEVFFHDAGPDVYVAGPDISGKPDSSPDKSPQNPDTISAKSLVDDTFAELSQGKLEESGAKIYVSAAGRVQLLDRWDLNADGNMDLVMCIPMKGSTHKTYSQVFHGPTFTTLGSFYTKSGGDAFVADFDDDDHPDIVFSNAYDDTDWNIDSEIFYGPTFSPPVGLSTSGAHGNSVADLNADGYLDIVFSNYTSTGTYHLIDSYIYWGSKTGFSKTNLAKLPASGPSYNVVADLDADGFLDIVFGNYTDGTTHLIDSYIYWGSQAGFSTANRTSVPATGPEGISVADLDNDGDLDLVISNHCTDSATSITSYVYLGDGTRTGFSATNRTELPTKGAKASSVADLNSDGYLDIIFSNLYHTSSYIYWGSKTGFSSSSVKELATSGCYGNLVADLDQDGDLDIAFSGSSSVIYKGPITPTSSNSTLPISLSDIALLPDEDPGSVYSRKPTLSFTSRVMDTGLSSPTYLTLLWKVIVPSQCSLKLQLRSAPSMLALQSATWYGPGSSQSHYVTSSTTTSASISPVHTGDRYIQYRAELTGNFASTPVLDRVELLYY